MAKRGVNKVFLQGNVGQDPDVRTMNNGDQVVTVSIATSEVWKDKQTNENKEQTEWHRVVFWRKAAEIIAKYVTKGSKLWVEGKLQTRKWTDQQGIKRYTTEVIAEDFQLMGGGNGQTGGAQQSQPPRSQPAHSGGGQQRPQNEPPMDFDDDIPF
ncbi:single-stranded DNA-binding protein [Enterobacter hormaechei]|nr:single-stranded DNA-binding protein [Enterobacter hormaechei]